MSAVAHNATARFEFTFMKYLPERGVPACRPASSSDAGRRRSEALRYRDIPLTRRRGLRLSVSGSQGLRIEDVEVVLLVEQVRRAGGDGVVVVLVLIGEA